MSGKLVLVVDDDQALRDTLRMVLEDDGYRAVTVPNGAAALEWLRRTAELPCLVLLDLMMPKMDGWQFRAAQKSDARLASIPVAVLSAMTRKVPIDADHYLAKPVSLDDLLRVVSQCAA